MQLCNLFAKAWMKLRSSKTSDLLQKGRFLGVKRRYLAMYILIETRKLTFCRWIVSCFCEEFYQRDSSGLKDEWKRFVCFAGERWRNHLTGSHRVRPSELWRDNRWGKSQRRWWRLLQWRRWDPCGWCLVASSCAPSCRSSPSRW